MARGSRYIFLACMMFFFLSGSIRAQEFQRTYDLSSSGQIRISNVSGDIKVTGYGGDRIIVTGTKVGPDRDMIRIEETSNTNDLVELGVRYPETGRCNAGVNFEVHVPEGMPYHFSRISSVSGNVEFDGFYGSINAESVSGNVEIRNVRPIAVNAKSVSGNVNMEIARLDTTAPVNIKLSSISGNVDVKAPADLNAEIAMSSISGSLKTDFPLEIQKQSAGAGQSVSGQLGDGMHSITMNTISGRINLRIR